MYFAYYRLIFLPQCNFYNWQYIKILLYLGQYDPITPIKFISLMITQLNEDFAPLLLPVEFALISPNSTLSKNSIPIFPLPEPSNTKLFEQYSERYKQNQTKFQKAKTRSVASYASSLKQQSELIRQLLQLPPSLRVESSSVSKGNSRSFLLKAKNSSKFYRKLPRLPRMAPGEQVMVLERTQYVIPRQKIIENMFSPEKLKVVSKCIEINSSMQIKEGQLTKHDKPQYKVEKAVSKSIGSPGPFFSQTTSLNRANTFFKQPVKRQLTDYLQTKDSMNRSPVRSVVNPKYKKGYLVYDSGCFDCFKHRNTIPQRNFVIQPLLPEISARDYCIIDSHTLKPLFLSKLNNHPIEIASLTKIVTCLLSILACKKYDVDPKQYKCRVSEQASSMIGTSAQLQAGDVLTIDQLLYGLMLPSGNDAAVALAENIGRMIQRKKKIQTPFNPILTFVKQMNVLYRQLICEQQHQRHLFKNPSGLMLNPNTTTVEQIAIFAAVACKNQPFSTIMNTKIFELNIMNERFGICRKMQWRNTNKLLWKGWEGVKTGTTQNAGHCFVGKYQNNIFALLDCETLEKRFTDAELLRKWIYKQIEGNGK